MNVNLESRIARHLDSSFPKWRQYPVAAMENAVLHGDLTAMRAIILACRCMSEGGWQYLAELAAQNKQMNILNYISSIYTLNWIRIAAIARDIGDEELLARAVGTPFPIAQGTDEYRERPDEDVFPTDDYTEHDYDNRDDESQAYEDESGFIVGSRPTNAFRDTFVPASGYGGLSSDVDDQKPIEGTDIDFLPEEPMPFEDEHPLFDLAGWGWQGYIPIYERTDDDETSILPLVYREDNMYR